MKRTLSIVGFLTAFAYMALCQSYKNPESIVYDSVGKRYFISNKAGNSIVQLDTLGQLTNFVTTGLKNPKGLLITGDTLISVNNTSVQGFLLANANQVMNVTISGSAWMNDVCTDGEGNLYISDTQTNKIHKIIMKTGEYSTLCNISGGPNGLLFDKPTNSLLICNSGSNAKIFAYDFATSTLKTLVTTKFSDLDGLARDNCGHIYVSSWGTNSVYAYDPLFKNPPTLVSKGYNGPADISIREDNQTLAIPNFNANTISLIQLNAGCSSIENLAPQNDSKGLNDSISIDWADLPEVSVYELSYSTDSSFNTSVITVQLTQSEAVVKDLSFNTTYFWRVRPIDGSTKSIFNERWSFTTRYKTSSSENQFTTTGCRIYPNPANSGMINIILKSTYNKQPRFSIFDLNGSTVKQGFLESNRVDVSDLKNGTYLFSVQTELGISSQKIQLDTH